MSSSENIRVMPTSFTNIDHLTIHLLLLAVKGQNDFQFRAIIKVSRESREGIFFFKTKQNKTRADLIAKKRERERSVMNLLVPVKHISNILILFVKKEFPKFTTDGYHHTQGLLPN